MYLNTYFQFLNNITRIFIYFSTHMYFKKNWKLLFKHTYQMTIRFQSALKKEKKKKRLWRGEKTVQVYKIKLLSVDTNFLPSTNLHALTTLIFINFLTRSDGDLHIFTRLWLTNDSWKYHSFINKWEYCTLPF